MLERARHYDTAGKADLTPRQREVLQLVAAGKTNPEIADLLGITLDGAKFHVREILAKLAVESREEAAAWWREERRPAKLLSRGFGWLVPRLAIVIGVLAVLAMAGVAVAFAVSARGGGGTPAAAHLPVCAEKDLSINMEAELRDLNLAQSEDPSVIINVRIKENGDRCFLNGELRVGPEPYAPATSEVAPASTKFDLLLDGELSTSFTLARWCEDFVDTELIARFGGAVARTTLDLPAKPCTELTPQRCFEFSTGSPVVTDCPANPPRFRTLQSAGGQARTDLLPKCNPERLRMGIETTVTGPPDAPANYPAPDEWTGFKPTWAISERPMDCEFKSTITVRLLDSTGSAVDLGRGHAIGDDPSANNWSILVRFRRATIPSAAGANDRAQEVHVPRTGGSGDYSTETTRISYSEWTQFLWGNWCGSDRSTATIELVSAFERTTFQIERPPCVNPDGPSLFFPVSD